MTAPSTDRADLRRVFDHLTSRTLRNVESVDELVALVRVVTDQYGDAGPRSPLDGIEVVEVEAGGVPSFWLIPDGAATDRWVVMLHGGGWMAGGFRSHSRLGADLALELGCAVLLVDYRLAPEHPFPCGLEDSVAAFSWATSNGPSGPAQPRTIGLVGDSAGGNLAAAATYVLVTQGARLPDRLAMQSPTLELAIDPDRHDRDTDPITTNGALQNAPTFYAVTDLADPRVSPLHGDADVLARFPPTLIQASSAEFLFWDARQFVSRLALCGVHVELSPWADMPHVWQLFGELLPEAVQAIRETAAFLNP